MSVDNPPKRRRGGRASRQTIRKDIREPMLPALKRGLPLVEPMSHEQVLRIDNASMDVLENVGMIFRDEIALEDWRQAGAKVKGERVYLDRGLIRDLIKTIPQDITYHARNPKNNLEIGGPKSIFVPMTGAPYIRDLEDKRRGPTLDDLAMFHKLAHMSPALHSTAHHIVEPMDHVVAHRHLRITYSSMKYSDKTFMGMTTTPKERRRCHGYVRHIIRRRLYGNSCRGDWKLQRKFAFSLGRDYAWGYARF